MKLITSDPSVVRKAAEGRVEEVTRFLIVRTHSILTARPTDGGTPVKTGFASASWICSVGVPSTSVGGSPESVDHGPQEAGVLEALMYKLPQGSLFLVNNCVYIGMLNYGHSDQAKPGFIERAHQRAINEANRLFI